MYQIYLMEGEYEPWWFFDGWKNMIVEEKNFSDFDEATSSYDEFCKKFAQKYPFHKTKQPFLTAFWDEEEAQYCETCEDDIQIYHGVMLLKDEHLIEEEEAKINRRILL